MSMENIFGVAGSAMNAQTVRLNLTASNIANAGTTASSAEEIFKGKRPVFRTILESQKNAAAGQNVGGVKVDKVIDIDAPGPKIYEPNHPQADKDGFLHKSNVNEVAEMVEMMAASRSFQNNVEVVNTVRELMIRTIDSLKN